MSLPKIESPIYKTFLDSSGLMVNFKPYTVKQEKLLLIAMESEDSNQILETTINLCQQCLVEDLDVTSLPIQDLEKLMIMIRVKSVGEQASGMMPCDHCGQKTEVAVNLETLRQTSDDSINKNVMINDKYGLTMKLPSVKDIGLNRINSDMNYIDIMSYCIDTVFDEENVYSFEDQTEKDREEFIDSLSSSTVVRIQKEFMDKLPTNVVDIKYKCPHCGKDNEREVNNILDFFI